MYNNYSEQKQFCKINMIYYFTVPGGGFRRENAVPEKVRSEGGLTFPSEDSCFFAEACPETAGTGNGEYTGIDAG